MKKVTDIIKEKIIIIPLAIFLFNLIFRSLLLNKTPNSILISEIDIVKQYHINLSLHSFYFIRYIPVLLTSLSSALLFYIGKKLNKSSLFGFLLSFIFSVAPWTFILSRFINIYVFFLFFYILLLFFTIKSRYRVIMIIVLIALFNRILPQQIKLSYSLIIDFFQKLFIVLDIRTLFFTGDFASFSLRIPKTGFFMYIDLLFLCTGIYCFTIKPDKIIIRFFIEQLIVGIIFLYIFQTALISYSAIIVFLCILFLIAHGLYCVVLKANKLKSINVFIILIYIFSVLFYQELFYNHFDKKNSSDWGYAEMNVLKYLEKNTKIKYAYISHESGKLLRYAQYFHNQTIQQTIQSEMLKKCHSKETICLLREQELSLLNTNKEDSSLVIKQYDGLPMYFVISGK